jgi:4-amino-4-deoxy-L-arabinose transferase-like glycosyltransferase
MLADRVARAISLAIDAAAIAFLAWSLVAAARTRVWAAIAAAIALADALWFAAPSAGRLILQGGGDDSLTYQTYARDIVFHGPLMLLGAAPGQAEPFYYQPLYAYFLAAVHLLFGDELWGLFLLQRLSLAAMVVAVCWMTRRLAGKPAGVMACVLGIVLLYAWLDRAWVDVWARTLWTEVLFVPLVAAWACSLMALAAKDATWRTAVLSGIAGGLGVLTRSTLLLGLPLAPVAVLLLVAVAFIGMATVRNWIASGRFVPITTSFGINLYLGNAPPARLPVHDDHAVYSWIAADDNRRQVIEYAWHEPAAFGQNLVNKALYSLGYFNPLVPGAGVSLVLIAIWIAALAGVAVTPRDPARQIPALIALCLFASVIVIFPSHFRLIFPCYVLLLPYAAAALAKPWSGRGTSYTMEG